MPERCSRSSGYQRRRRPVWCRSGQGVPLRDRPPARRPQETRLVHPHRGPNDARVTRWSSPTTPSRHRCIRRDEVQACRRQARLRLRPRARCCETRSTNDSGRWLAGFASSGRSRSCSPPATSAPPRSPPSRLRARSLDHRRGSRQLRILRGHPMTPRRRSGQVQKRHQIEVCIRNDRVTAALPPRTRHCRGHVSSVEYLPVAWTTPASMSIGRSYGRSHESRRTGADNSTRGLRSCRRLRGRTACRRSASLVKRFRVLNDGPLTGA